MAHTDQAIRRTRRVLRDLVAPMSRASITEGAGIPTCSTDGIHRSVVAER